VSRRRASHLAVAALALGAALPALGAGDAARGKDVYETYCTSCHSPDKNRVGPAHRGVFGRQAGTAQGYQYSSALAASRLVWNDETLDRWLTNPEALVPGQKMGVQVAAAEDRRDVIEYLKTLSR
jgi:cytochrome c